MKKTPHVALLVETANAYCRSMLKGVEAYVRDNQPWSLFLAACKQGTLMPEWKSVCAADGIIARIKNEEMASFLAEMSVPVVNIGPTDFGKAIPGVMLHEEAVADLVVEHLLERGYQQFAFYEMAHYDWSIPRGRLFYERIEAAGGTCFIYPRKAGRENLNWETEQGELAQWLHDLPKPIGLLTLTDFEGQQVLTACRNAKIAVPEQIGVISIGDDDVYCDLTFPQLSSVTTNASGTGYQAAAMLDRLMAGEEVSPHIVLMEPFGIHLRHSTDVTAITDPDIVTALQLIRSNACDGIKIEEIVEAVALSRRTFEQTFKKLVGRTPHEEILRVKLTRAKRLLAESELSLTQIATRVGLTHASYLCEVFRAKTNLTPSQYRAKFKSKRSGD